MPFFRPFSISEKWNKPKTSLEFFVASAIRAEKKLSPLSSKKSSTCCISTIYTKAMETLTLSVEYLFVYPKERWLDSWAPTALENQPPCALYVAAQAQQRGRSQSTVFTQSLICEAQKKTSAICQKTLRYTPIWWSPTTSNFALPLRGFSI